MINNNLNSLLNNRLIAQRNPNQAKKEELDMGIKEATEKEITGTKSPQAKSGITDNQTTKANESKTLNTALDALAKQYINESKLKNDKALNQKLQTANDAAAKASAEKQSNSLPTGYKSSPPVRPANYDPKTAKPVVVDVVYPGKTPATTNTAPKVTIDNSKINKQPPTPTNPNYNKPVTTGSTNTTKLASYTPGTPVITNTGEYVITQKKDNKSDTGYSIVVTKNNRDGSKVEYKLKNISDTTYQYKQFGTKDQSTERTFKLVGLQNTKTGRDDVIEDHGLWKVLQDTLASAWNKSDKTPAKNVFVDKEHSPYLVGKEAHGVEYFIDKKTGKSFPIKDSTTTTAAIIKYPTANTTTTNPSTNKPGTNAGTTNPSTGTNNNINVQTTIGTTTNYYKDKPPASNTGNGSLTVGGNFSGIQSNYTISKTNDPNVFNIYNSSGQQIATIRNNYTSIDNKTYTRVEFPNGTKIEYGGKEVKIGFDSKGNVTSVVGGNATILINGQKTDITIKGNDNKINLTNGNNKVNVEGQGNKIQTNQKGNEINVTGDKNDIKSDEYTSKDNINNLKGDKINLNGNNNTVDAKSSTLTAKGDGGHYACHNGNILGNNNIIGGSKALTDEFNVWGNGNTVNGEKDKVNVYDDKYLINMVTTALAKDNASIDQIFAEQKAKNEADINKYFKNDTKAAQNELSKIIDKSQKEVIGSLINQGVLNANGHAYLLKEDASGRYVWVDPDTGITKDGNKYVSALDQQAAQNEANQQDAWADQHGLDPWNKSYGEAGGAWWGDDRNSHYYDDSAYRPWSS